MLKQLVDWKDVRCDRCQNWQANPSHPGGIGRCVRYAPSGKEIPLSPNDGWCGEFVLRGEEFVSR